MQSEFHEIICILYNYLLLRLAIIKMKTPKQKETYNPAKDALKGK